MAIFKVGQRVRCVKSRGGVPEAEGREATILKPGPQPNSWELDVDGIDMSPFTLWAYADQIVPLTDPDAEKFVRDVTQPNPAILKERAPAFVHASEYISKRVPG